MCIHKTLSTTCTVTWCGKNTDSDEDSYKRKSKRNPKNRIINHQTVYESSWVKEQNRKVPQFEAEQDAIRVWHISGNVVVGDGKRNVCVLVT